MRTMCEREACAARDGGGVSTRIDRRRPKTAGRRPAPPRALFIATGGCAAAAQEAS